MNKHKNILMKIDLRSLKYYILNEPSKAKRREHMKDIMGRSKITNYEIISSIPADRKLSSGAISHASIIQQAMEIVPFKPFVLLEDDCDTDYFPDEIDVPHSIDALYLGISRCAANENGYYDGAITALKNHPGYPHLLRFYNMLSTHAIMFITPRYASAYAMAMVDASHMNQAWDTVSTRMSPFFQVYLNKRSIFFQQSLVGGQEPQTRFNYDDNHPDTISVGQTSTFKEISRSNELFRLKNEFYWCGSDKIIDLLLQAKENKSRCIKMYLGVLHSTLSYDAVDANSIYLYEEPLFITSGTETLNWILDTYVQDNNPDKLNITNDQIIEHIKNHKVWKDRVKDKLF